MGATTLSVGFPQLSTAGPTTKRPDEKILIIGAGVSGLSTAESLRNIGFKDITILEARDRLGGRIHTSQHWKDAPVDLGASWIHGTRRNPITRLAKEAGVTMLETDYEDMEMFGPEGRSLSSGDEERLERVTRLLYKAVNRTYGSKADSLHQALFKTLRDLSPEERVWAEHLIHSNIELSFAEDSEALDAQALMFGKEFKGTDVLFPQGYFEVFRDRYRPFSILTNHVVQSIDLKGNTVQVLTSQGELQADRVVLTTPLGVLQRGAIAFRPGLSREKQDAISTLGMGCLNKVYLRFPESFWPKNEAMGYFGSSPGRWSDWLNLQAYQAEPILMAFHSGTIARDMERQSNEEITANAMRVLNRLFGSSIPNPVDTQITRWATDPFSFGSYSALHPGSNRSTVKALRSPINDRLFFAGEATSLDYPSTVHGAYLSGQRVAKEVLSVL